MVGRWGHTEGDGGGRPQGLALNMDHFVALPDSSTTANCYHRMAWVGRDLKDHESPTPLPGRATNLPIY